MTAPRESWARVSLKSAVLSVSAGASLCALTLGAGAASAQGRGDEFVFVDLGRWVIVQRTNERYCELRLNSNAVSSLVLAKSTGRAGTLQLIPRTALNSSFTQGSVTFEFDDTQFSGEVVRGGIYTPSNASSELETKFRQARTLTVRHGGQVVANLSLDTSSAGFRLLKQCADQWRNGWTPRQSRSMATIARAPDPAPASRQPARRSQAQTQLRAETTRPASPGARGPYPPNRALTPLNPGQWIRAEDFRRIPNLRGGDGTIRFTLLVNEEGRVEECAVDASSGSRDLDARTCRTLQERARFEPATDSRGEAKTSTYTSNVKFAPER